MRDEVNNGKSRRQVAEELHTSKDTVMKYTRDIPRRPNIHRKISEEQIAQIRQCVKKYQSKIEAAKKLDLSYWVVRWYTQDIHVNHGLSEDAKKKIRDEIKKGKTKTQVAREMNLSMDIVSKYTNDIYLIKKKADISYNAFLLLQEIIHKGYAFPSKRYGFKEYQNLKKKFPNLCRVKIEGRVIFFFEDKSNIAARAFLASLDERITNYFRLKRVIKAFKIKMSEDEKRGHVHKKKPKKQGLGKILKVTRLQGKDDSYPLKKRIINYKELEQVIKTI
jgi:DNA-binding NarL/FixJ family response regulator